MKKLIALFLAAALCLLTVACGQPQPTFPDADYPLELAFSSGAGAWSTTLTLNADGTFTGMFSDANMGEASDEFPNGTVYLCSFSGRFSAAEKLDDHSYPLTLEEVVIDQPEQEEWIEDGILYVAAGPYGLYNDYSDGELSRSFVLYAPTSPTMAFDEEQLLWWPGQYEPVPPEILGCWALYNTEANVTFFTGLLRASSGGS